VNSFNYAIDADRKKFVCANQMYYLKRDATQMAGENARLRSINAKMLAALRYLLPLLQQGLPATVDFDWTEEAVAKVQDALAEAERDP
jgi:hypothetical protein